jgi:hypothetical protein
LAPRESVAVLGFDVVLEEAYSTGSLQVWYLLIDMHFSLFHVESEHGPSIADLKKQGNSAQKFTPGIIKFRKSQMVSKPAAQC